MIKFCVILRRCVFALIIIVSMSVQSQEGGVKDATDKSTPEKSPAAEKQGLSSDVYEKEESAVKSFSGRVNLIRETDVIEVFFDGKDKGPFLLKDDPNLGVFKERLAKSQKNKNQSVNVKVSDEVITSVELVETKAAPTNKKSDMESVLNDIMKK